VKTSRLFRQSCEECKVKFQYPGWKHTQEKTWNATSRTDAIYCTHCKAALCCICNPKFIKKQKIELGKGSPKSQGKGSPKSQEGKKERCQIRCVNELGLGFCVAGVGNACLYSWKPRTFK
jgi:hypothetical protein